MRTAVVLCALILVSMSAVAQSGVDGAATAPATPVPQYHFKLADPVTLPIGTAGSPVSAIFGCTSDHSVFLQVITLPDMTGDGSDGDIALYGVQSPTKIVRFSPKLASGYRRISPIARYFAAESKVVALAYGVGIDHGDAKLGPESNDESMVLLTFDRKGTLSSSKAVDANLRPEQIAAYESGDLLLVAWDKLRKKSYLLVTDENGSTEREIHFQENDPVEEKNLQNELVTLHIYPYGKNLLLLPQDTHRPILEVNEYGVVHTHILHIPKGYERGLPISLGRRSWKFRMIPDKGEEQLAATSTPDPKPKPPAQGLEALQSTPGTVLEFDPADGDVLR